MTVPSVVPRRARRLGARPRRPRQRRVAGRDAGVRPASGRSTRTRRSPPRARPSACPRARWATRRSATSTWAPGAIVFQDLARIDIAVREGRLAENEALVAALGRRAARAPDRARVRRAASTRPTATSRRSIETAARHGVEDLVIHAFTDGRDTSPTSGAGVGGRPRGDLPRVRRGPRGERDRALLRDGPRQALGPDAEGASTCSSTARASTTRRRARRRCKAAYERGETDEFIAPTTVGEEGRIRPGDSVIAFNFRPDRMRQISPKLAEVAGRYTTHDALRRGVGLPRPVPEAPAGDHHRRR